MKDASLNLFSLKIQRIKEWSSNLLKALTTLNLTKTQQKISVAFCFVRIKFCLFFKQKGYFFESVLK